MDSAEEVARSYEPVQRVGNRKKIRHPPPAVNSQSTSLGSFRIQQFSRVEKNNHPRWAKACLSVAQACWRKHSESSRPENKRMECDFWCGESKVSVQKAARHPFADAAKNFVRTRAGRFGKVNGGLRRISLPADHNDFVANPQIPYLRDVDERQVHADVGDDGRKLAPDYNLPAAREPPQHAVGITGRERRNPRMPRRHVFPSVAERYACRNFLHRDDLGLQGENFANR